jgi:hypothetical protein
LCQDDYLNADGSSSTFFLGNFTVTPPNTFSVTVASTDSTQTTPVSDLYVTFNNPYGPLYNPPTVGTPYTTVLTAPVGCSSMTPIVGDVTGNLQSSSVVKVNGASIPASKSVVGTNSSGQIIDASSLLPTALQYWSSGTLGVSASTLAILQNKITFYDFVLPYSVYTGYITYKIYAADNTANLYDIGIYNLAGTLVAHSGATAGTTFAAAGTTMYTIPITGGPVTLTPGTYMIATTTNCASACATLYGNGLSVTTSRINGSGLGTTSGGVLSGTLSTPAASYFSTSVNAWWFGIHN